MKVHQNGYASHFTDGDVALLEANKIDSLTANAFKLEFGGRLRGEKVRKLVTGAVPSDWANKYNESRFSIEDMVALTVATVSPDVSDAFDRKFSAANIAKLVEAGAQPEVANKYAFPPLDVIALVKTNISPEVAAGYEGRARRDSKTWDSLPTVNGKVILELQKLGVSGEVANAYALRFDGNEVLYLARCGISPQNANAYPDKITSDGIVRFYLGSISAEMIKAFNEKFTENQLFSLFNRHITPEYANTAYTALLVIDPSLNSDEYRSAKDTLVNQMLTCKKLGVKLSKFESFLKKAPKNK